MVIGQPISLSGVYQQHLHFMRILQIYYPINQPVAMAMGYTVIAENFAG